MSAPSPALPTLCLPLQDALDDDTALSEANNLGDIVIEAWPAQNADALQVIQFVKRACNSHAELLEALEFARSEAITARGVLWTNADVVESMPNGARHAAGLRRSAEKLDEVVRRCDATLSRARGEA